MRSSRVIPPPVELARGCSATRSRHMAFVAREVPEVLVQVGGEDATVKVVRHAAAIHRLPDEVAQGAPGDHVVLVVKRLGQVRADERHADAEVRLVEVVRHVPPELAVLAPLLRRVTKAVREARTRRLESLVPRITGATESRSTNLSTRVQRKRARGDSCRGLQQTDEATATTSRASSWFTLAAKKLVCLLAHLEGALEDAEGEAVGGLGGEPEAEVLVRVARLDLLQNLLERLEPAGQQVAVLQHDPQPAGGARLEELLRLGSHALAERHVLELGAGLEAHLLAQLEYVKRRVRPGGQDEHHRRHRGRLLVDHLCQQPTHNGPIQYASLSLCKLYAVCVSSTTSV
eukprot:1181692-Prorocentrum_minimum.AAC.2